MAYSYKYVPASQSMYPRSGVDPKSQYIKLFQETLNQQFYNSSNWWTICEETCIGSKEYKEVDVRISHVINAETGLKLGDDWKTLYFKEITRIVELGKYFIFDDNTWLVVNTELVKNLTGTCTVRRCNNTLRWIDESTGIYYEEPCAIEYLVKEPRDYVTQGSPFITPGGFLHIQTQLNERTNLIRENQRFLFGNRSHWTGYKVIGTGINDFINTETYDTESSKILTLDVIANFVNYELDDVINGIADVYTNDYNITLNMDNISGSPGGSIQLYADILYNGNSASRILEWNSSNETVATVSASGLVNFLSTGSSLITANIENNSVTGSCLATITSSSATNREIIINPNTNYVLEGKTTTYSVYLYENNIQLPDAFSITCNGSNVPSTSYTFVQNTDNTFTISNILRNTNSYLTISCITGSPITTDSKDFVVYLRGGWLYDNA